MIAANTGFLFRDLPFIERIGAAARAGFDAVEFHDEAQRETLDDVRAALRDAGLPLLGLNARMGDSAGCAGVPGEEAQARADIVTAIETAQALGGTAVHVLAGKPDTGESAWATYRENLIFAADKAAKHGLTILIEPLCAKAMPGYLLPSVARAAQVIETIDRPNVKIMFDVFHVAGNGDDIGATFSAHQHHIGHVQIADPQTRNEPGPQLVAQLRALGWHGAIGAEYVPTLQGSDAFAWMV